jgi:hypothetical protein
MNDGEAGKVRQGEEFQFGRARLFRLKNEKKLRAEIANDKEQLFALFKSQGLSKELEFTECLKRLLMNFSKMASYRGILQGFEISSYAAELREDRARLHLFQYLQKHPKATNHELIAHLDAQTRPNDPLWAPLPPAWKRKFKEQGLGYFAGEYWQTALKELPTLVLPYLSRVKSMAKDAKAKNALFNWPELIKRHKRERK